MEGQPTALWKATAAVRLSIVTAAVLTAVGAGGRCQAQGASELYERFRVALPSADLVVLLDASQSMRLRYHLVRQAAVEFIRTLGPGEYVHLRAFAAVPAAPLEGPGDRVRAQAEQQLPAAVLPGGTDLGLAMEKALDFLERPGGGQVAAIFLLTDGLHEPPRGSPYSRDFERDPDWLALRSRAHALCARKALLAYGLGLRRQTDIGLLRRVFPARNVEVVVGEASAISGTLARMREWVRRRRLREAVEEELRQGRVEVSLSPSLITGSARQSGAILRVRNGYTRLPIRVMAIQVEYASQSSRDIRCSVKGKQISEALDPTKELQVPVTVEVVARLSARRLGRTEWVGRAGFRMVPAVSFVDRPQLEALELAGVRPSANAAFLEVDLRIPYGIPYWAAVLAVLVLLMPIAWGIELGKKRTRRRKALALQREQKRRMAGRLKVWPVGADEPHGLGSDLSTYRTAELILCCREGALPEAIAGSPGEGVEVLARLSAELVPAAGEQQGERPEFRIEVPSGHTLACESRGAMREVSSPLVLCDEDLIEIDGRWRLRYSNSRLRRRYEVESAQ